MTKKDTQARLKAVRAMESVDDLLAALNDLSTVVVEAAAQRLHQPRAAGALVRTYLRLDDGGQPADPGCWARIALLEALGRLMAPEGEEVARRAVRTVQVEPVGFGMGDTATGLRVAAASLLANLSAPGALVDLAWLLFDFEPNVGCSRAERPYAKLATRVAAARAIGALGDPGGAAVLGVKLAFPGEELPDVLSECMDSLVALEERRTVELLTPWLAHGNPYLVTTAATAMAKAGGAKAVPLLVGALETAVSGAREPLVYALASIRAESAREALAQLAEHHDETVRRAAHDLM